MGANRGGRKVEKVAMRQLPRFQNGILDATEVRYAFLKFLRPNNDPNFTHMNVSKRALG
jgi:hypothetical protein